MNALVQRRAASPYARRLARERGFPLAALAGSGPAGRILAADVLAFRQPDPPPVPVPRPAAPPLAVSAAVSLTALARLVAEAASVGLVIDVEDAALRAARAALAALPGAGDSIAVEEGDRQIPVSAPAGLSIGAERRLRLAARASGRDTGAGPAAASLLILFAARALPVAFPLLPGRSLRIVLAVNQGGAEAHALLCADPDAVTPAQAMLILDTFAGALEDPLALLA